MEENSKKLTNLDQIGEFGLIDSITKDFEIVNDTTELSVGDDAAILDLSLIHISEPTRPY